MASENLNFIYGFMMCLVVYVINCSNVKIQRVNINMTGSSREHAESLCPSLHSRTHTPKHDP